MYKIYKVGSFPSSFTANPANIERVVEHGKYNDIEIHRPTCQHECVMTAACNMQSWRRQLHLLRCNLRREVDIDPEFAALRFAADINQTTFWKRRRITCTIMRAFYNRHVLVRACRSENDFISNLSQKSVVTSGNARMNI